MIFRTASIGVLAAATFLSAGVLAQSTDTEFLVLLKARRAGDAEALARERIQRNPKDDVALSYLAQTVSQDTKKRNELIPRMEKCIQEMPQSARCHHALASLYAGIAATDGITAALKYASDIKAGFARAVELDGKNFQMRRDLIQFYLQAPGLVGGSVRRAIEHASEFGKLDASRGQLLRAEIYAYEKEWDRAESLLSGIRPANDSDLADLVLDATVSLGFGLVGDKQFARAKSVFERAITASPNTALAHMGLGRALLEQKKTDAAIASLERAIALDAKVGAHYRLAVAYENKGDKQKAIAALEQFLSYRTSGAGVDEARKRLANLRQG
jgi:tetratricopeptide (TPR) repeat protein